MKELPRMWVAGRLVGVTFLLLLSNGENFSLRLFMAPSWESASSLEWIPGPFGCPASQWFQMTQNLPKIRLKNSWNCLIILVQASFWRIMGVKGMQSPETEIYVIKSAASWLRNRKIKWTYFWRVLTIWNHSSPSRSCAPKIWILPRSFESGFIEIMEIYVGNKY